MSVHQDGPVQAVQLFKFAFQSSGGFIFVLEFQQSHREATHLIVNSSYYFNPAAIHRRDPPGLPQGMPQRWEVPVVGCSLVSRPAVFILSGYKRVV